MAKRGNSEGSIYKRDDGRWVGVVHLGYEGGKRRRRALYGRTRAEVAERLKTALRDVQQGLPLPGERHTVGQFLATWLEDSVRPTVRARTHQSYAELVRLHIAPDLGKVPLAKLTPQHIQRLLNTKLTQGLSPRRVQYIHAVLRLALGRALRWGFVARNVATLVSAPRGRRLEVRPLTPDEVRCFLRAAEGDRLEALYVAAIALGLRQGELLGLRWDDLDLERGTVSIRRALQRVDGALGYVEPKSERSRRTLAVPPLLVERLREHRLRQLQERLAAGGAWRESGLVFTSSIGTPLDGRNVTRRFQRALDATGLPRQRFHDLRHACASLLLSQGLNLRDVMETLGHSQIGITADLYGHLYEERRREVALRMEGILRAGS